MGASFSSRSPTQHNTDVPSKTRNQHQEASMLSVGEDGSWSHSLRTWYGFFNPDQLLFPFSTSMVLVQLSQRVWHLPTSMK
jgi:hypothetical protein